MATLAHGRPLLTTSAHRPIPELIHGENVWMVKVDQPDRLREAITKLLADADLRRNIGEGAFELAQLFTWDKIASKTVCFYDKVLSEK
jgi:glycosyltransferase involved in cell wall biosynthesis